VRTDEQVGLRWSTLKVRVHGVTSWKRPKKLRG
jgi:hypothetical protein